jgi:hypothetical protein
MQALVFQSTFSLGRAKLYAVGKQNQGTTENRSIGRRKVLMNYIRYQTSL